MHRRSLGKKAPFFIAKVQMSYLTVDLFLWNQMATEMEPFETFLSTLEQAPLESPEKKLRHTDLVVDIIKEMVMGRKYLVSKLKFERKIGKSIDALAKHKMNREGLKILLRRTFIKNHPKIVEFLSNKIHEIELKF